MIDKDSLSDYMSDNYEQLLEDYLEEKPDEWFRYCEEKYKESLLE